MDIAYVSWSFENTLYETKILTIVSICVKGQLGLKIENRDPL